MSETRFGKVEGGCSNCLHSRHRSRIGKGPKEQSSEHGFGGEDRPYCVVLAQRGDYANAMIECGPGEFDLKCPLVTWADIVNMVVKTEMK